MMRRHVQNYYGKQLQTSADLKTDACCTFDTIPDHVKPLLSRIHTEVSSRYYGCGLIAPDLLEGLQVLDLGCGAGQDCFILSALVGERGSVTGVDMTDEQLAVAEKHIEYHRKQHGHKRSNVRFLKGYIEQLSELHLEARSFDLVISNCVLNLTADKGTVLQEVFRLLRPGGELYFSDVYSDRRIPAHLLDDPILYGECLSGALYWNDFLAIAKQARFTDPRLVTHRPLGIGDAELTRELGPIQFCSATYRLFRLDGLESACEDYGQAVVYLGTIQDSEHAFTLDAHHVIPKGKLFPVCGNTWRMLADSRFSPHFRFIGDFATHYGIFEGCGATSPFARDIAAKGTNSGCC